jgi:hypothetical protein
MRIFPKRDQDHEGAKNSEYCAAPFIYHVGVIDGVVREQPVKKQQQTYNGEEAANGKPEINKFIHVVSIKNDVEYKRDQ